MPKYQFTERAVEDLSNIWNYTYEYWSEQQADKYYSEILRECMKIAENPSRGKTYESVTSKLRGVKINKHIIFYRMMKGQTIEVERILHERMDLKNRLSQK